MAPSPRPDYARLWGFLLRWLEPPTDKPQLERSSLQRGRSITKQQIQGRPIFFGCCGAAVTAVGGYVGASLEGALLAAGGGFVGFLLLIALWTFGNWAVVAPKHRAERRAALERLPHLEKEAARQEQLRAERDHLEAELLASKVETQRARLDVEWMTLRKRGDELWVGYGRGTQEQVDNEMAEEVNRLRVDVIAHLTKGGRSDLAARLKLLRPNTYPPEVRGVIGGVLRRDDIEWWIESE